MKIKKIYLKARLQYYLVLLEILEIYFFQNR